jgi:hypothetical protein
MDGRCHFSGRTATSWRREKKNFRTRGLYFSILAIAFSFLAFASMGGYLYGSAQTARSYEAVFKEFTDNVESRQIFYFHGYKVVPKEKVIVVKGSRRGWQSLQSQGKQG